MQPSAQADLARQFASQLAALACQSLLDEVMLTPKPGLVDRRGSGAHRDMTLALMCRSARTLQAAFFSMAQAAWQQTATPALRARLGSIGRQGEQRMFNVTAGINTHRGAIWALGLLLSAAAMNGSTLQAEQVCSRASTLACIPDDSQPVALLKGSLACQAYGVGGARAEAEQAFPHLTGLALPALHAHRARGDHENTARINTLLALMSQLDDTCLLARGGRQGLQLVQTGASAVLDAGGAATLDGRRRLYQLENDMLARSLSPGGSADLLAATLLLDRLPLLASI
ncbi:MULTISPECIES: triphosphoribosyl-dephospho-CoA synthase [Aquitalea]|uniref:triphosphoribosyl-dephospho-CoA synthase n=1 Tax=Aquitalea TaxID=407217 RepID=UPI001358416F|nr:MULTISPECIES: triphosphoribosyl-dephospho-CoA synthase [Aquitalea]